MMRAMCYVWLVCLLLGLTACSPIRTKPISKYALAPQRYVNTGGRTRTNKTLLMTDLTANPGYKTDKMIYLNVPFRLKAFATHEWVAPPAQMLQSILDNAILAKHYFRAVVVAPYVGLSDYTLSVRLLSLQQEFLRPVSSEHLAMQLVLINSKTNRVITERVFQSTIPAQGNNPYGGVLSANRAAVSMAAQIANFVVRAVRLSG